MASTKDIAALKRLASEQCWTIEYTTAHLRWFPPSGGDFVGTSKTPNQQGTLDAMRRDLQRAGLVLDRGTWKRYRKEVQQAVADGTIDLPPTPREIAAFIEVATKTDDPFCHWHEPPKEFLDPVGAAMHRQKCPNRPKEGETDVKRKMDEPPPYRERLTCPLCPFYCWISQPHLYDTHLRSEHGKAPCPHCIEVFNISGSGSLADHILAGCPNAPVPEQTKVTRVQPLIATLPASPTPIVVSDKDIEERAMADRPRAGTNQDVILEYLAEINAPITTDQLAIEFGITTKQAATICSALFQKSLVVRPSKAVYQIAPELAAAAAAPEPQPQPPAAPAAPEPAPVASEEPAVAAPAPDPTPIMAAAAPVVPIRKTVTSEASDDDLFDLLEMVLDGPVMVTRHSLGAINAWMDATRTLLKIKEEGK